MNATSILDDYEENCGEATPHMYSVPNLRVTSGTAKRNIGTPTSMRGPGAVPGLFALESAMDELAVALDMDPVQLRLINEPELDEGMGVPFSSRHLKECLTLGAEKFGWSGRDPRVGSMRRDGLTLGWGMAACSWIAERFDCSAAVELRDDGTARVASATSGHRDRHLHGARADGGRALGIPSDRVEVVLGDTSLPPGTVVRRVDAHGLARGTDPLGDRGSRPEADRRVMAASPAIEAAWTGGSALQPGLRQRQGRHSARDGLRRGAEGAEARRRSLVGGSGEGTFGRQEKPKLSSHSFGAHFVEVTWQPEIARLAGRARGLGDRRGPHHQSRCSRATRSRAPS